MAADVGRAFRNMLDEYVPKTNYSHPEFVRIVDLGCGICDEADALSSHFSDMPYGRSSEKISLLGIDANIEKIKQARRNNPVINSCYIFVREDAKKIRSIAGVDFDVAVARHPNVEHSTTEWMHIFRETRGVMKNNSLLIATSFDEKAHTILRQVACGNGFEPCLDFENPYAVPDDGSLLKRGFPKGLMYDRLVLMARPAQ